MRIKALAAASGLSLLLGWAGMAMAQSATQAPPQNVRTARPTPPAVAKSGKIEVKLVGNAAPTGGEFVANIVSFAIPFGPGVLTDATAIKVTDATGKALPVFTKALLPWRIDGKEGTIRSLLVQFELAVAPGQEAKVTVEYGTPGNAKRPTEVPVAKTLTEDIGNKGPQVWALLPAKWMCESWVVGPQLPAAENKMFPEYETRVAADAAKQSQNTLTRPAGSDDWLFDRTTTNYKMYVRTGELKYLKIAYHCANFVRSISKPTGAFGGKYMYCYPRAQGIHYMLSGDERALDLAKRQMTFFEGISTEKLVKYVPGGGMWTERNTAYSWAGLIYPYEWFGTQEQWKRSQMYADTLFNHQTNNPDGKGYDGSWGHNWDQHDSDEAHYPRGASAWMTALMVDPMFEHWMMTGDAHVPTMVTRWCEFLIKTGLQPDGNRAYYVINCFGPSKTENEMEAHNLEMAYMLAMGIYFSQDPAQQQRFYDKFKVVYASGVEESHSSPPRRFNWAFQNSSAIPWFIANSTLKVQTAGK